MRGGNLGEYKMRLKTAALRDSSTSGQNLSSSSTFARTSTHTHA